MKCTLLVLISVNSKRGRPKLTWVEEIRGLMEEKGLMEEDWNDGDKWKKKIILLSDGRRKM